MKATAAEQDGAARSLRSTGVGRASDDSVLQYDTTLFFLLSVDLVRVEGKVLRAGSSSRYTREGFSEGGVFERLRRRAGAFLRSAGWRERRTRCGLPRRYGSEGWSLNTRIDELITSTK